MASKKRTIPKGCGQCSNKHLELLDLVVRCFKCGWTKDLTPINEILEGIHRRNRVRIENT